MMSVALRLATVVRRPRESQRGLTMSQFTISLAVVALGVLIAYFLGTRLGAEFNETVAPAFDWI